MEEKRSKQRALSRCSSEDCVSLPHGKTTNKSDIFTETSANSATSRISHHVFLECRICSCLVSSSRVGACCVACVTSSSWLVCVLFHIACHASCCAALYRVVCCRYIVVMCRHGSPLSIRSVECYRFVSCLILLCSGVCSLRFVFSLPGFFLDGLSIGSLGRVLVVSCTPCQASYAS